MVKKNCWEAINCGRQPGGHRAAELGVCPATLETAADGINCGENGGRACWAITGTLCGGQVQGTHAQKCENCLKCAFFQSVQAEEGVKYSGTQQIMEKIF